MTIMTWAEREMRRMAYEGNFTSVDRIFWWARQRLHAASDVEAHLAAVRDELDGKVSPQ